MTEHYYSKKPTSREKHWLVEQMIGGRPYRFLTASSVFSKRKVDHATMLLSENWDSDSVRELKNPKILDLGCGYGVLGIVIAKTVKNSTVDMVEVNERAASLAEKNLEMNHVSNATVFQKDFFGFLKEKKSENKKYDVIVANPPIAIGMEKLEKMIVMTKDVLNKGGSLQIVARHGKGGSRLEGFMQDTFGNCVEICKGGGFRVYKSVPNEFLG